MNNRIKELTENIYNDGVAKAREEADRILKEANKKAEKITSDAQAKADAIVSDAKSESEKINASLKSDLQSTKTQVIEIAKQEVSNLITAETSKAMAGKVVDNEKFLKEMILEILKNWNSANGAVEHIEVLVPEKMANKLEKLIQSEATEIMGSKLTVKPVPAVKKGFQIVNNEVGFKISFTDEDFEIFFASLMKPKIREYLFNS
ncbi:MAG TPA: hypothetical protein VKA27_16620 [Sunxiuqinia sp.]|nr:hypothetical protein [Sunxiuqinia sp.]